jgi:hypothetical protein
VLSWAVRGQAGKGHVNEKDLHEVIALMDKMGYHYQSRLSTYVRSKAVYHWFKNTFMIFYNMKNFYKYKDVCTGESNTNRTLGLSPYFLSSNTSQFEAESSNYTVLVT